VRRGLELSQLIGGEEKTRRFVCNVRELTARVLS
jgi:hypothetical protein